MHSSAVRVDHLHSGLSQISENAIHTGTVLSADALIAVRVGPPHSAVRKKSEASASALILSAGQSIRTQHLAD